MTLPFDHAHDQEISGMVRLVDMEQIGCESSIHDHDIDFSVTMVGLVDVPDSGPGGFRCRCAVDTSSWLYFHLPNDIQVQPTKIFVLPYPINVIVPLSIINSIRIMLKSEKNKDRRNLV